MRGTGYIINPPPPPPAPPKQDNGPHMWCGCEQPAHLDNIKDWQLKCGDILENILFDAFKQIYARTTTGIVLPVNVNEDVIFIWPAVKDALPGVIKAARDNGIPVWDPTADNYEF